MSVIASDVVVAIPAKNEAERLGACLASLAAQKAAPPFRAVILANNCTDATAAIARAWSVGGSRVLVREVCLAPSLAHAGMARRQAMQWAAALCTPGGVLMTTDADTTLPSDWVAANLAALAAGADAVAGRALIDPLEARAIPRYLHALDALECAYATLLDQITTLLAPDPHDPWPRHDEHSGASIAVRRSAYEAAGGIPSQRSGEDRAFFAALRKIGARIRHAPEIAVIVSGRLDGRAEGGMAQTIRARIAQAPEWLDDRLEPVADHVSRLLGTSPRPERRRLSFAALEAEMAAATTLRNQLQRQAIAAIAAELGVSPADPDDIARCAAGSPWPGGLNRR